MFRFKRYFFIISNFFLIFTCFLLIYEIRYAWLIFEGIDKRSLHFSTLTLLFFYSVFYLVITVALKTYEINKIAHITESLLTNFFTSLLTMGLFGIYFYFTQTNFARLVFFSGFLLSPVLLSLINKLFFYTIVRPKRAIHMLYFGSEQNFQIVRPLINKYNKWFPMELDYIFIDDKKCTYDNKIKTAQIILLDSDQYFKTEDIEILNDFEITGGKIYTLIDIFAYFDQSLPAEIIHHHHYDLFSAYKLDSYYYKYIKRIGDIFISIIILILTSPIILLTALFIKITSKGPVFFTQERVTINNKVFKMIKFRSMKIDSKKQSHFTSNNDLRVTLVGKIIRPLRIDELPQLFNILKGDMSFIGPRPERREIITMIVEKHPLFKKRQLIKPGLTGWAQVKYKYVNDIDKMNKKLSYDLFYIHHLSFVFDLKILLYTFETILFRRGAI